MDIIRKYSLLPETDPEDYLANRGYRDVFKIVSANKASKKELDGFIASQDPVRKNMYNLIYSNEYLPLDCLAWIERNNQHIHTKGKVHIVDNKPIDEMLIKHVDKLIRWVASIAGKSSDIEVWIFLCPYKKRLPETKKPLGRNEVNSGVSYMGKWIQVFRGEEVLKVLIHELLHYYDLDIKHNTELDDKIALHGRPLLVNEAYNELFAIYLHTLYYSKVNRVDFMRALECEVSHSAMMCKRVLDYYGIRDSGDISTVKFIQHSNVYSYYILKYHMMRDFSVLGMEISEKMRKINDLMDANLKIGDMIIKKETFDCVCEGSEDQMSLRMSCHNI
jgi:hypothetical protein